MSDERPCDQGVRTEDDSVQLLELRKSIVEREDLGRANECKVPVATFVQFIVTVILCWAYMG